MVLALILNHDPLSPINFVGLLLCLSGIVAHVAFKFRGGPSESTSRFLTEDDFPLIQNGALIEESGSEGMGRTNDS